MKRHITKQNLCIAEDNSLLELALSKKTITFGDKEQNYFPSMQ